MPYPVGPEVKILTAKQAVSTSRQEGIKVEKKFLALETSCSSHTVHIN